jgi:D-glycero-D-manno-heptose 1,7-bisphosphate phosphatase
MNHSWIFHKQDISSGCLFLDRDGVIIKDKHYIKDPFQVELCTGSKEIFELAEKRGIPIIIITNQSGISQKFSTWDDYEKVTMRMLELLEVVNPLVAIYANSQTKYKNPSLLDWRKPGIGMIQTAVRDFNVNLGQSLLVGDRLSDIQCGRNAGIGKLIHVKTGHGEEERQSVIDHFEMKSQGKWVTESQQVLLADNIRLIQHLLKQKKD